MKKFNIIILFFLLIFSNCGRKQKNIFDFPDPDEKPEFKVNKLSLPAVKGVKVERAELWNKISWQKVSILEVTLDKKIKKEFIGYNVYRLVNSLFVPKKTVNKFWIRGKEFLDTQALEQDLADQSHSYLVRAVFKINDKIFEGPASQVAGP